jgi:hypothetical protein
LGVNYPEAHEPQREDDPSRDSGQLPAATGPLAGRKAAEPPTPPEEEPGSEYPDAGGWVAL